MNYYLLDNQTQQFIYKEEVGTVTDDRNKQEEKKSKERVRRVRKGDIGKGKERKTLASKKQTERSEQNIGFSPETKRRLQNILFRINGCKVVFVF